MKRRATLIGLVLVALVILPGVPRSGLAAPDAAQQAPAQQPASNMQDMMKMHEQMMAEMKAGDAALNALVQTMNSST